VQVQEPPAEQVGSAAAAEEDAAMQASSESEGEEGVVAMELSGKGSKPRAVSVFKKGGKVKAAKKLKGRARREAQAQGAR
jgi:hypothetical protein